MLIMTCPGKTGTLLLAPLGDNFCSVFNKKVLELVTSEMRTQPGPVVENQIGLEIGLASAPPYSCYITQLSQTQPFGICVW